MKQGQGRHDGGLGLQIRGVLNWVSHGNEVFDSAVCTLQAGRMNEMRFLCRIGRRHEEQGV